MTTPAIAKATTPLLEGMTRFMVRRTLGRTFAEKRLGTPKLNPSDIDLKWADKAIKRLREAGFEIRAIPVEYPETPKTRKPVHAKRPAR